MLAFPNCKINLGLKILRKRADGFHDLETVFYPVAFSDCLEVIKVNSEQETVGSNAGLPAFNFSQSGLLIAGSAEDNLCFKAYQLLKKDFPQLPAVQMHLHKNIPMGAGLGGGSADAAFALKLLNDKFQLQLSVSNLLNYAALLGSDAPFFIINKPCFATSRGELLEEIKTDLSSYMIVLINPGIHINTGWAFSRLTGNPEWPQNPIAKKSVKEIIQQPIQSWKDELVNDFEVPVFEKHPAIAQIKKTMYHKGAVYAAMSGSGSTVFGIFNKKDNPVFDFPAEYFIKRTEA